MVNKNIKRKLGILISGTVLMSSCLGNGFGTVQAEETETENAVYAEGEILVMYDGDTTENEITTMVEENGGIHAEIVTEAEEKKLVVVDIAEGMSEEEAARQYSQDQRVIAASPNYEMELFEDAPLVNDSELSWQEYLYRTSTLLAWKTINQVSHEKVKVAVLDTGVDFTHPDLENVVNVTESCEILDDSGTTGPLMGDGYANGEAASGGGHGTIVSGIIAAEANNELGIAGVGSSVDNSVIDLVAVDVFKDGNKTTLARVIQGMEYAKSIGAKVVNMSLGMKKGNLDDSLLQAECDDLRDNGIILVCAAGNYSTGDNGEIATVPSDYDSTISVIALENDNSRRASSCYGTRKDLSAPGADIYSTKAGGGYETESGTSMAAPMVTATVAMMCSVNPELTEAQVRQILQESAFDIGTEGFDVETAAGLLNVRRAVESAVPGGISCELPYRDVSDINWFYDSAGKMYQYGIMTGMNSDEFGPCVTLCRAQFATILYRYAGEPEYSTENDSSSNEDSGSNENADNQKNVFPDVGENEFYTKAVEWAASRNIIEGYENGMFGPGDPITREQMALMLYRYVQQNGYVVKLAELDSYADGAQVSDFAAEAMQWATASEIIRGNGDGLLLPQGNTIRAECATMMSRLMNEY